MQIQSKYAKISHTVMAALIEHYYFQSKPLLIADEKLQPVIFAENRKVKIEFLNIVPDCDLNIKYVADKKFDSIDRMSANTAEHNRKEIGQDNLGNVFTISKNNVDSPDYLKHKYGPILERKMELSGSYKPSFAICPFSSITKSGPIDNMQLKQYTSLFQDYLEKIDSVFLLIKEEQIKFYKINRELVEYAILSESELDAYYKQAEYELLNK